MSLLVDALLVALVGGVLALDRTAVFQTMVSRPLVTGPVVGFFLGDAWTGLVAGAVLELLFIAEIPVGGYVPQHETSVTACVTALAAASVDVLPTEAGSTTARAVTALPVALVITLPAAWIFRAADQLARNANARFFRSAEEAVGRGGEAHLVRENMKGLVVFFVASAGALFMTVLPLLLLVRLAGAWVGPVGAGGAYLYPAFAACVFLGLGAAYRAAGGKGKSFAVYLVSAAAAAAVIAMVA